MKHLSKFDSFLNEGYYNKEWNITNILKWLNEYAKTNNLKFEKDGPPHKLKSPYGGGTTSTQYTLGDFRLFISDDKVAGAPRLNSITVSICDKVEEDFKGKNCLSLRDHVGNQRELNGMLDEKFKKK